MSTGIEVIGDTILHDGIEVARIKPNLTATFRDRFITDVEAERLFDGDISEAVKEKLLKEFEAACEVGLLSVEQFKRILDEWEL